VPHKLPDFVNRAKTQLETLINANSVVVVVVVVVVTLTAQMVMVRRVVDVSMFVVALEALIGMCIVECGGCVTAGSWCYCMHQRVVRTRS
jgi:hypothetical protein